MPLDDFRIPRIELPQIGSGDSQDTETGSVHRPDRHHANFRRYLQTGEGLDDLVGDVQRDTVGNDGRTDNQRDHETETARQESVLRRYASGPPQLTRTRPQSFFDESEADLATLESDRSRRIPVVDNIDFPDSEEVRVTSSPSIESQQGDAEETPGAEAIPGDDAVAPVSNDETDNADIAGKRSSVPDDPDDPVPPPGSLWESTHHGVGNDPYDPGDLIVDPPPARAEPGPMMQWLTTRYRNWWQPMRSAQKAIIVAVAAVLVIWVGYLGFSSDPSPHSALPAPADPLVDTASRQAPTDGPLPPMKVESPGAPARSQPPANAFSGDDSKAWIGMRAFNSDLQTIQITYAHPVCVTSIFVVPGFEHKDTNGRDLWYEHRIVTLIEWRIGGKSFFQTIDPEAHTGATIQIPAVTTQVIIGRIRKTVPPPSLNSDNGPSEEDINSTFAISKITINGHLAG